MLYLLDDDKFDAIINTYSCNFINDELYESKIKYFKNENEIDIDVNILTKEDIICYHNSFPNEITNFIQKMRFKHELNPVYTIVCFSGDSKFLNHSSGNNLIELHKDRFYFNLKLFVDSNYDSNKLIFGKYDKINEAKIIFRRINNILFYQSNDSFLDIKDLKVDDLKRICLLADFDFRKLLQISENKTIGQFKDIINLLIQNI